VPFYVSITRHSTTTTYIVTEDGAKGATVPTSKENVPIWVSRCFDKEGGRSRGQSVGKRDRHRLDALDGDPNTKITGNKAREPATPSVMAVPWRRWAALNFAEGRSGAISKALIHDPHNTIIRMQ
jgi:hypothetical protein